MTFDFNKTVYSWTPGKKAALCEESEAADCGILSATPSLRGSMCISHLIFPLFRKF